MKELVGSPGTKTGLILRLGQCGFATASIAVMVSAAGFSNYTAFCEMKQFWVISRGATEVCTYSHGAQFSKNMPMAPPSYLIASMGLQVLWSFGLACLDVYALRIKRDLQSPVLVSLFAVGDWVTATLSLAAACSSAGIVVLFSHDLEFCKTNYYPCAKYELSVAFAFITWFLIALSSHLMFWILASV